MKLSNRILTLNGEPGQSDGWEAYYRARQMITAGESVTMLCIGEHDRRTAPFILDAMDGSAKGGNTGYAYIQGSLPLREAISARVTEYTGAPTTAENVMVTTGGQAALFAAMCLTLDPGDTGVIVDPHYTTYPGTVRGAGGVAKVVQARADEGFQLNADDLAEATKGAKTLLINTPNNPTGAVYTSKTLEGIAEVCKANDLWLISDEVYDSQVHEGAHLSPRGLPGMVERTIVVGSMSKSHVMTGFRLGWLIGTEAVIGAARDLSNATTYGVPGFIQDAATSALRDGDQEQGEVAALYRRRRDKAVAALSGSDAIRISPPDGAMYVMVDIRPTGLTGDEFAMRLIEAEKIAAMPGESFGEASAGHLRIALTVDDDALVDALTRLKLFAEGLS
ncbi:MAG: pyridoxal phosphate-dependent aminotransferase [Pseudomonadota bacterium]